MKSLLLFLAMLPFTYAHAEYTDLRLNTDDRAPFEFLDNDRKLKGLAVDIITCSLDKLDVKYDINVVPWSRAQKTVESGLADGFFSASQNSARDKYASLSTIVVDQYWNWYLSEDVALLPSSMEFKNNINVSSWIGSNSLKWLKDNNYKVKQPSKHNKELVKRLIGGRLKGVFASNIVFEHALNDLGESLGNIKVIKGIFKPMGVYFSKQYLDNNIGFLESFNKATLKCKGL